MAIVVVLVFWMLPPPSQMTNGHLGLLMLAMIVIAIMLGFPTAFTLTYRPTAGNSEVETERDPRVPAREPALPPVRGRADQRSRAVRSEAGSAWWVYTARSLTPMIPFPIVEATAWDLPGNCDSFAII